GGRPWPAAFAANATANARSRATPFTIPVKVCPAGPGSTGPGRAPRAGVPVATAASHGPATGHSRQRVRRGMFGAVRFSLAFLLVGSVLGAQPALTPFDEAKARALLRTQLPCLGCHELDGEGGHSAPSLTTVGARRSADYIAAIIADPQTRLPGAAMPRHPMSERTRDLITRFLARDARGADVAPVRAPTARTANPPDGAALYVRWCA